MMVGDSRSKLFLQSLSFTSFTTLKLKFCEEVIEDGAIKLVQR